MWQRLISQPGMFAEFIEIRSFYCLVLWSTTSLQLQEWTSTGETGAGNPEWNRLDLKIAFVPKKWSNISNKKISHMSTGGSWTSCHSSLLHHVTTSIHPAHEVHPSPHPISKVPHSPHPSPKKGGVHKQGVFPQQKGHFRIHFCRPFPVEPSMGSGSCCIIVWSSVTPVPWDRENASTRWGFQTGPGGWHSCSPQATPKKKTNRSQIYEATFFSGICFWLSKCDGSLHITTYQIQKGTHLSGLAEQPWDTLPDLAPENRPPQ